jgi:hypothetical protein
MQIHSEQAIKRDIKFIEHLHAEIDVQASDNCCWNCLWSIMTYYGLWCDKDLEEVDFRDMCVYWQGESQNF